MGQPGYHFCLLHQGQAWAGGSGGRVDILGGEAVLPEGGEGWRCALSPGESLWLGGEAGGLFRLEKGRLEQAAQLPGGIVSLLPVGDGMAAVTEEGGCFLDGSSPGIWLAGEALPPGNPVVGAALGRGGLLALTAGGSLFSSKDGTSWEHREFHRDYAGYYPPCTFTALGFAGGKFLAAALGEKGEPLLLESLYGGVWKMQPLDSMLAGNARQALGRRINGVCCEEASGQVFLLCDAGELAVLPGCPKCMRLSRPIEEGIWAGAAGLGKLWLAGESFAWRALDLGRVRQLRVGAEYAKTLLEAGALLVDLRGEREFAALAIPGSVNLPVERLTEGLEQIPRDTTLVFVCASGALSPGACETALEMGFDRVHDLGGVGEWWRQFPPEF